jgi:hypothetical protein
MKNVVFWNVAPCRSCVNRRFMARVLYEKKKRSEERKARCVQTIMLIIDTAFRILHPATDIFKIHI